MPANYVVFKFTDTEDSNTDKLWVSGTTDNAGADPIVGTTDFTASTPADDSYLDTDTVHINAIEAFIVAAKGSESHPTHPPTPRIKA
jgi:hypothetical protein